MLSTNNRQKLISLLEHKNYRQSGSSFIIFPDNEPTMGQIVRLSNRFGIKIIVIGSGSSFEGPMDEDENTVYLSTQKLNSVTALDRINMFAEMQAGCRWKKEFGDFENEGLYFPLSHNSIDDKRTVGGIFSSLRPDSPLSDMFTAVEFICSDGTVIKYGSRTLKNAAGYDLVKFMTGSQGRFGIVTSLTVRLFPQCGSVGKEDLQEHVCNRKDHEESEIYKSILNEIDPNSVFR